MLNVYYHSCYEAPPRCITWSAETSNGSEVSVRAPYLCLIAIVLFLTTSTNTHADQDVHILVFMENGIGSAAQAQPHIDALVGIAAAENGWGSAKGKYVTRRKSADKYIDKKSPEFGIISLGGYLAMREPRGLVVIGVADVARAGGRRYHLVSSSASGVSSCKGKKLATNHASDRVFIDNVVAGGSFTLSDFTLVETRRPVQTIKKVIKGKAACALIDNAQLDELPHIDGAAGIKSVWSSKELPPMAVVSFSGTSSAMRAKFKSTLGSLCSGAGKKTCNKVGIRSFNPATDSVYASQVAAYGK
jgi:hypothetical protein